MAEVDDTVLVAANFRQFEAKQAQNFCSWAKLNIRRRDIELELTTAHHLGGLLPPGVGCQDLIVLIVWLIALTWGRLSVCHNVRARRVAGAAAFCNLAGSFLLIASPVASQFPGPTPKHNRRLAVPARIA